MKLDLGDTVGLRDMQRTLKDRLVTSREMATTWLLRETIWNRLGRITQTRFARNLFIKLWDYL